jgi:hypothetical protein
MRQIERANKLELVLNNQSAPHWHSTALIALADEVVE